MNAKHTPGPWTRNRAINTVDMGRYSVICPFGADSKKHVSEIEANMRIISAAPDLLEALESLLDDTDVCEITNNDTIRQTRATITRAKNE